MKKGLHSLESCWPFSYLYHANSKDMVNIQETWLPVIGYEQFYNVSNLGNIKRLHRVIISAKRSSFNATEKIMTPQLGRDGYLYLNLLGKRHCVHRLIMASFVGISNLQVDHINSIKTDNRLENLRYCTPRENSVFATKRDKNNFTGTHLSHKKWRSRILFNKKYIHLGMFDDRMEAVKKYNEAVTNIQLYGRPDIEPQNNGMPKE